MRKVVIIIVLIGLILFAYLVLSSIIGINNTLELSKFFDEVDYRKLLSCSLAQLLSSIIWLLICINVLIILMLKNRKDELYKPLAQITFNLIIIILSILVFFIVSNKLAIVITLSSFCITILLIMIVLNSYKKFKRKNINT